MYCEPRPPSILSSFSNLNFFSISHTRVHTHTLSLSLSQALRSFMSVFQPLCKDDPTTFHSRSIMLSKKKSSLDSLIIPLTLTHLLLSIICSSTLYY